MESDLRHLDAGEEPDERDDANLPDEGLSVFAQRLSHAAMTLTKGLRAVSVPGVPHAGGSALTSWMEHVIGELNGIDVTGAGLP